MESRLPVVSVSENKRDSGEAMTVNSVLWIPEL